MLTGYQQEIFFEKLFSDFDKLNMQGFIYDVNVYIRRTTSDKAQFRLI